MRPRAYHRRFMISTRREQAVVNEHERSSTFPVNTKRFRNLRELCEELASLKDTFKVYTFRPSLFERLRYLALSWMPTFNKGYDVERELVRSFSRGPFTTRDPNQATAFFVPIMPYLQSLRFPFKRARQHASEIQRVRGISQKDETLARDRL